MVSATTTCLATCTHGGRVEIKSKINPTSTSTSSGATCTCITQRGGPPTEMNMVFEIRTRSANPIAFIKQVVEMGGEIVNDSPNNKREEHIAGGSAAEKVSEIQHTVERSRLPSCNTKGSWSERGGGERGTTYLIQLLPHFLPLSLSPSLLLSLSPSFPLSLSPSLSDPSQPAAAEGNPFHRLRKNDNKNNVQLHSVKDKYKQPTLLLPETKRYEWWVMVDQLPFI